MNRVKTLKQIHKQIRHATKKRVFTVHDIAKGKDGSHFSSHLKMLEKAGYIKKDGRTVINRISKLNNRQYEVRVNVWRWL